MWYLNSESDKRVIYVLPGNNITIGRSNDAEICNFTILDDPSISRKHVTLSIIENDLFLEDFGSKYGTFINSNNPVEHNKKLRLVSNDKVVLGKMGSIWKVHQIKMITCTSTLKVESLQNLKSYLIKLGGELKNDWDETCSYLTMPAITLTIKVVLALVQNSYIVNMDYWDQCIQAINKNTVLPDPGEFVPNILEPNLNKENVSFLPTKERCSLFAGKKIIFFSKRQLKMYKNVLEKCSGTALLLSDSKLLKSSLIESDVLVIQYNFSPNSQDNQNVRDQISEITGYLNSNNKRIVADAEIGLAILYCSISKYCNPCFNFSEIIKQVPQENKSTTEILAHDTQDNFQGVVKKENMNIDESLTPRNDPIKENILDNDISSSKRKRSEDDDEFTNDNKKIATDYNASVNNSKKRGADCDLVKPSKKIALEKDENEEMFNFMESHSESGSKASEGGKKLNLLKPIKRKFDCRNLDEEDLFNFVEDSNSTVQSDTNSISKKIKTGENKNVSNDREDKIDLSALRGIKLQELREYNSNMTNYTHIKKEDISEIDEKLSNMDLGSTVVVVNKDLIMKKEPLAVSANDNGAKNFKKFKKVWPIKMQMNTVSTNC